MRTEETQSGYVRVWLDKKDKQRLVGYYDDDPVKQVAIRLMLESGLRAEEVPRVSASDLIDSEKADFTRLKIREAKAGRRETIVPPSLAQQIRTVSNIQESDVVVNVTDRTVRNWVYKASEHIALKTDEPDWNEVSPHDLRRTFASGMVQDGVSESLVMKWGGWENYETFRGHYFLESDEQIEKQLQRVDIF